MSETITTTTPPTPAAPTPAAPETFSKDYVRELREENKGWRLKAQEQETAAKTAKDALEKAQIEANEKVTAAERSAAEKAAAAEARANERTIRAELRTAAIRAGMIDLDGLKMLDLSSVKLGEDGSVEGADELIEAAKKGKPFLFSAAAPTTSNPNPPPSPKAPAAKHPRDMTDEEFAAAVKNKAWRK